MRIKLLFLIVLLLSCSFSCQAQAPNSCFNNKNIFQFISDSRDELIEVVSIFISRINDEYENKKRANEKLKSLSEKMDFTLMWNTLYKIESLHINKDNIDYRKLMVGAVNGMLQAVDPWSRLEPRDTADQLGTSGIGAVMEKKGRYVSIVSTMRNSPAELSGIKRGDLIESVDGKSIRNLKIEEVVSLVRGDEGTKVSLKIYRKNNTPKELRFEIERMPIFLETVSYEIKPENNNKIIGIIKIKAFDENTLSQFIEIVDIAESHCIDGLVIDLRDNPGGYIDVANKICAVICGRGKIINILENTYGSKTFFRSEDYINNSWPGVRVFEKIPIVCLINNNSASASEIMAVCLRENLGIKLIGKQTYGKGVAQSVYELPDSLLVITTFKWLSPGGHFIDGEGIEPDFDVEVTEEDIKDNIDPQMDKGVEIIKRYFEIMSIQNKFFKVIE